jgi:hypothetical protein
MNAKQHRFVLFPFKKCIFGQLTVFRQSLIMQRQSLDGDAEVDVILFMMQMRSLSGGANERSS